MSWGEYLIDGALSVDCPVCFSPRKKPCVAGVTHDERIQAGMDRLRSADPEVHSGLPGAKRAGLLPGGSKWDGINARAREAAPGATRQNKTEQRYQAHLEAQRQRGEILWWAFEAVKLQLANGSSYAPDFLVIDRDGFLLYVEVKGARGWKLDDEGRTKWKVAGELHPYATFRGVTWTGCAWKPETYRPRAAWPPERGGE